MDDQTNKLNRLEEELKSIPQNRESKPADQPTQESQLQPQPDPIQSEISQVPPASELTQTEPKKPNTPLFIGIVLLLLALVSTTVFLTLKNRETRKSIINQVQPTLNPSASPSPSPIAINPSPDPITFNWKAYKNNIFGFEIKYPNNSVPIIAADPITYELLVSFQNTQDKTENIFSLGVSKSDLQKAIEYEKWQVDGHVLLNLEKETQISFFGNPGVRLDYKPMGENGNRPTTTIIINNGKYSFSLISETELSDQIFSTFKFLASSPEPKPEENQTDKKVDCTLPRPEICTLECINPPPYLCGSNGKSYCSACQACADLKVEWYISQDSACSKSL